MKFNKIVSFITALSLLSAMTCMGGTVAAEEIADETETTETAVTAEEDTDLPTDDSSETEEISETELSTEKSEEPSSADAETTEGEESSVAEEDGSETEAESEETSETEFFTEETSETETTEIWTFPEYAENVTEIIGDAVKYVPYSFLLYNKNYPTETKEPEPEPTEPAVQDKTVTVPSNLEIVEKGTYGNFYGNMYSDKSLFIEGPADGAGEVITIPSSIGGKKVRTVYMDTYSWVGGYFLTGITKVIVPNGVAFQYYDEGEKFASYSQAIAWFAENGITLEIKGWSNTPATSSTNTNTKTDVVEGRLPEGLQFYPESLEIYGIPLEAGTFVFSIDNLYDGVLVNENREILDINTETMFELTVQSNTNQVVFNQTDTGYSILNSIGVDVGGHDYILNYEEILQAENKETLMTDLAKKTPVEIIELMGGNYTIGNSGIEGSYYLENTEIFPNTLFYLNTNGVLAENDDDPSADAAFVSHLENGDFNLDLIEIGCNGADGNPYLFADKQAVNQITDNILSTYTYIDCAEVLGEFSCTGSTGAYYSGDLGSAMYSYKENGCEILLHFDIEKNSLLDYMVSTPGPVSSEKMRDVNPQLFTVWVRTDNSTGTGNVDSEESNQKGILYRSEGEFEEYVNLWLNGQLLVRGEDYDAESGSTKITVYAQTFQNKANLDGVNTIAAEFRTTDVNSLNTIHDTNTMHVTAQNFRIKSKNNTRTTGNSAAKPSTTIVASSANNASTSTSSAINNSNTSAGDAAANTEDKTPFWVYVTIGLFSLVGVVVTAFSRKQKIDRTERE